MVPTPSPSPTASDLDTVLSGSFTAKIPSSLDPTQQVPLNGSPTSNVGGNYELEFDFCGTFCVSQTLTRNGIEILNSTSAQAYTELDRNPGTYTYWLEQCRMEYIPYPVDSLIGPICTTQPHTVSVSASTERTLVMTPNPTMSWPLDDQCPTSQMLVSGSNSALCIQYTEITGSLSSYGPAATAPMGFAIGIPGAVVVGGIVVIALGEWAGTYCSIIHEQCDYVIQTLWDFVKSGIEILLVGSATEPAPYSKGDEQEARDYIPDPFGNECVELLYHINVLRAMIAWRYTDLTWGDPDYIGHLNFIKDKLEPELATLEQAYRDICGGEPP